ncbi:TIGR03086 family metal-binding protein [Amycolatopsis sp. OK19-0408]|uniref:TIGR03086 family metal-binding protein n=1 Tax=Amycolatopsis iheyensis TaxID=2945988 RepID=A0A9X2NHG3_9PSEU|nr:TIGR03086 family metal-binding protein [Amycolatopsis iheyensis]MCR6487918.1 TIGR03086 family metal-binding protein [Amycolatopsis iheyensis]
MDTTDLYRRAQDGFDAALAEVREDQWDLPSACTEWTVRDVTGHVIWGQRQLQAWATGADYAETAGAPGAPHPAVLATTDPLETWRAARKESVATLTDEALRRTVTLPGLGAVPLAGIVTLLITDLVAHRWDIGSALGRDVRLEPDLVDVAFGWARANAVRRPGFFGPELVPPAGADEQTRMLAFLGRRAVPA